MMREDAIGEDEGLGAPLMESSFAALFPKYREQYIREAWPEILKTFGEVGVIAELNLLEGHITVKTSRKTFDPCAILKARDVMKLICRSVPLKQAAKMLRDEEIHCDIVKIRNLCRNRERFVKRRQRLLGPNGCTLKAIELLTDCYVLVQGNTVSVIGPWKGLKVVRRIVEDCMNNQHPIYTIKTLMIKRELEKDETLAGQDWARFLPTFKKKNVQTKKPKRIRQKGEYTPFPPAPTPSKIDKQLDSGEYFMSDEHKQEMREKRKLDRSVKNQELRELKRLEVFQPPVEEQSNGEVEQEDKEAKLLALKEKLAASAPNKKQKTSEDVSRYLA